MYSKIDTIFNIKGNVSMNKNMLIVQSLLLLPLITPSLSLGMKKKHHKKSYKDITTKNISPNLRPSLKTTPNDNPNDNLADNNPYKELINSVNFPSLVKANKQITNSPENSQENLETPNEFFISAEASLNHDISPENIQPTNTIDTLTQTIVVNKEEKGFGIFGSLSYYLGDSIKNIISYLQTQTFDITNGSHFNLLNEAIKKSIENKDFDSLVLIATLCQSTDEYKNNIRISNEIAATAFEFCDTKYKDTINNANNNLQTNYQNSVVQYNNKTIAFAQTINELVKTYQQDIHDISKEYSTLVEKEDLHVVNMNNQLTTVSALNSVVREKIKNISNGAFLTFPNNEIIDNKNKSQELFELLNKTSNLPKIEFKEVNNK